MFFSMKKKEKEPQPFRLVGIPTGWKLTPIWSETVVRCSRSYSCRYLAVLQISGRVAKCKGVSLSKSLYI